MIYGRQKENIEVSHILLRFEKDKMLPADTLELYNKTLAIRNRLVGKKAEAFEKVAKEVSQDPSAQTSERAGYLGWTSTMMFVQPFEDAMYSLAANEISQPVRSQFGYHLIKVHTRRPDPGKVNVAHIMFGFSKQSPSEEEVDSLKTLANTIYQQIKGGQDYTTLCQEFSTDKQSAAKGGELGYFGITAGLPKEFKDASFALQNINDISEPIKTAYGFHILKLIGKKGEDTWDEAKANILNGIKRSDKQATLSKLETSQLAKTLGTKENNNSYNELNTLANTVFPTDSVFLDQIRNNQKVLFSINNNNYTIQNFEQYIEQNPRQTSNVSTDALQNAYYAYLSSILGDKQKEVLLRDNAELRNLSQEYYDGILLFDIMNREVWEKAATDTLGLENYFKTHKEKYQWSQPKFKGLVVHCKDQVAVDRAKKAIKKVKNQSEWANALKSEFSADTVQVVRFERGLWQKGENVYVDYEINNKKKGEKPESKEKFPLFFVVGKNIKAPEDYTDVKGLVVSDYQDQLEKDWISSLRKKYSVEVDQAVLNTIK